MNIIMGLMLMTTTMMMLHLYFGFWILSMIVRVSFDLSKGDRRSSLAT